MILSRYFELSDDGRKLYYRSVTRGLMTLVRDDEAERRSGGAFRVYKRVVPQFYGHNERVVFERDAERPEPRWMIMLDDGDGVLFVPRV